MCCEVISGAKFGHFKGYLRGQIKVISGAKLILVHFYSVFRRFLAHSLIIVCFCFWPVIRQFSKNCLFQKKVQKLGFSIFCVLSLGFKKYLFLVCQKAIKIGVQSIFVFLVVEREEKGPPKMITGISGFGFLGSKNGRFVTHSCFSKKCSLKPLFL